MLLAVACTPSEPAGELVLASWNIEHLAAGNGAGCRPRTGADFAELRRVADALDADVIALQEVEDERAVARVFDPGRYDILLSGRPERGLGDCRGEPGQARTAQRTGFAIDRARLAALGLTWRALPPLREIGVEGRRWGTRILLEPVAGGAPGRGLELVSLHLKSGCAWGRLDARDLRRAQCRILRRQRGILEQWIDQAAAADTAFVLMGDFNRQLDQPNDDFWRAIDDGEVCQWVPDRALGRRCRSGSARPDSDADLTLANAGVPFPYPYNPEYPYAIDHFVFSGAVARSVVPRSYRAADYDSEPAPSDHHPIRIRLRIH